jgi:putative nucleotidyltransferase with HDIG domain
MSVQALIKSERLRDSFTGRSEPMVDRERRGELIVGAGFVAAALALAVSGDPVRASQLPIIALFVLGLAVASNVRFDVGAGFTVPTQAVFVPMLFAVPVSLVPLLVALSLALGLAPAILAGRTHVSRILSVPGNSWFAVGPSLVLLLAHDQRPDADWGILLLALAAQLACDFSADAVRERLRGGITTSELLEEAWQVDLIDLALSPLGLLVAIAAVGHQWVVVLIAPLFGVLMWLSKERRARLEQLVELSDAYRGTALLLGDVVEADDTYTGAHCKDVVNVALDVARELRLDASGLLKVEFGALLHDIGKIAVPKTIVNKPGELSEGEWDIIRTHTVEGQRMLERVGGVMGEIGQIVRSHHERWDGRGYPDGLRGDDIPVEARIISCCDAFNAMTTTRPYRRAMPQPAAVAELLKNAGSQFDPRVVDALIEAIGAAPAQQKGSERPQKVWARRSTPASALQSMPVPSSTAEPIDSSPAWRSV